MPCTARRVTTLGKEDNPKSSVEKMCITAVGDNNTQHPSFGRQNSPPLKRSDGNAGLVAAHQPGARAIRGEGHHLCNTKTPKWSSLDSVPVQPSSPLPPHGHVHCWRPDRPSAQPAGRRGRHASPRCGGFPCRVTPYAMARRSRALEPRSGHTPFFLVHVVSCSSP
jgi:hypothetical protein